MTIGVAMEDFQDEVSGSDEKNSAGLAGAGDDFPNLNFLVPKLSFCC